MRILFRPLFLGALLIAGIGGIAAAEQMSVTVRETQLRENPAFLGRVLEVLSYAARVEVIQEQGPWYRVEASSGRSGWVHSSALTTKRIVLEPAATSGETGASGTEVALAGRGFNEEVENRYKDEQNLDFSKVDRIEGYEYPPEVLLAFLEEGGLEIPEGGAE
jgi:hypothetical protein